MFCNNFLSQTLSILFRKRLNEDIVEPYYWHLNFPIYTGKGYKPIKLEDYHYFSENNQFGSGLRQMKGGSIQAFQSNLQNLIQIIKTHLMPLFQEVKKAHFYKKWIDKIVKNDANIRAGGTEEQIKIWRSERDEAIRVLKDKWVSEVDGGKMWQLNKSATEQGLDFALLPQLFFGTNIESPLDTENIREKLDKQVYAIEISLGAKEQVANFLYRFYMWLPTAISDTQVTFRLKIAALKNIYAQIKMYGNLLKPLLKEILKKSEGYEKSNFYADFDLENPEFVNLFDYSYSFIKIMGIRGFERNKHKISELEFEKNGFFCEDKHIIAGEAKGKKGYIYDINDEGKYLFKECERGITKTEFDKIEKIYEINRKHIVFFPVFEQNFSQRRRMRTIQTQQGPQQVPYNQNIIDYIGNVLNIVEIASYRRSLQADDFNIISAIISEVDEIKDELEAYVNGLEDEVDVFKYYGIDIEKEKKKREEANAPKEEKKETSGTELITNPIKGLLLLFKAPIAELIPEKKEEKESEDDGSAQANKDYKKAKIGITEDIWKMYNIFKMLHGFIKW
jgi:hypothetical protein